MQFHIRTLLGLMVAVSLFCGMLFAAPPIVAIPLMCLILWICPAFWINGIIYGRGAWRPFFIGGVMAGIGPHLAAVYMSLMNIGSFFDGGSSLDDLLNPESRWTNLMAAGMLLGSGPFAVMGGLVGVWVYWMFKPAATAPDGRQMLGSDEYLIVSGRLTTLPVERQG